MVGTRMKSPAASRIIRMMREGYLTTLKKREMGPEQSIPAGISVVP